jgi:hypothetical protein
MGVARSEECRCDAGVSASLGKGTDLMQQIIARIRDGQSLSMDEMAAVVDAIMKGDCDEDHIAAFLLVLRAKGKRSRRSPVRLAPCGST